MIDTGLSYALAPIQDIIKIADALREYYGVDCKAEKQEPTSLDKKLKRKYSRIFKMKHNDSTSLANQTKDIV
jgi:hypothetical protein